MARESQAGRRRRVAQIAEILHRRHPDARCTLDYRSPLELLVATILAAQCTDQRVNRVTPAMFARFGDARALADADQQELEDLIRPTGFYRNKAKNILASARRILETFGGQVPRTMEDLLTLPGVARKTANVILGNAFGRNEGITVDTHVIRLAGRLGLTMHADPVKIEKDLMALLPVDQWCLFSHLLVFHGRTCCTARKPDCAGCPVNHLCPAAFTFGNAQPSPAAARKKRRAK